MKIKRILAGLSAFALILGLSACAKEPQPEDPTWEERHASGVCYLAEGNYEEAIKAFTEAIEIDPEHADSFVKRAEAYIASGQTEAAISDYEGALELDSSLSDIYLKLADLYIETGAEDSKVESLLQKGANNTDSKDISKRLDEITRVDSVEYELVPQSIILGDNGSSSYDRVRLKGDKAQFEAINGAIEDFFNSFDGKVADYYEGYKESSGGSPFKMDGTVEITNNGDGIFSFKLSDSGYIGGAGGYYGNTVGMTFDLNTGEMLTLTGMLPGIAEADLYSYLKSVTWRQLVEEQYSQPYELWHMYETFGELKPEYFGSYVKDGEIILEFQPYTVTSGAFAPPIVNTGIFIDNVEQTTDELKAMREIAADKSKWYDCLGEDIFTIVTIFGQGFEEYADQRPCITYWDMHTMFYYDPQSLAVNSVMFNGTEAFGWGLWGNMTYPEIVENCTLDQPIEEPEGYFNMLDDMYTYNLSIPLDGGFMVYTWFNDPYSTPAASVELRKTT